MKQGTWVFIWLIGGGALMQGRHVKLPAYKAGHLEEVHLFRRVFFLMMILNILLNSLCRYSIPHCPGKVSVFPEFSTP